MQALVALVRSVRCLQRGCLCTAAPAHRVQCSKQCRGSAGRLFVAPGAAVKLSCVMRLSRSDLPLAVQSCQVLPCSLQSVQCRLPVLPPVQSWGSSALVNSSRRVNAGCRMCCPHEQCQVHGPSPAGLCTDVQVSAQSEVQLCWIKGCVCSSGVACRP